jgi:hypothetical protein
MDPVPAFAPRSVDAVRTRHRAGRQPARPAQNTFK